MAKREHDARWIKKGNTKLGIIWNWATLYSNEHFETEYGIIKGTCPLHCSGCYVEKAYRSIESGKGTFRKSVRKGHARNTLAIRESIEQTFEELNGYIVRAKKKPHIIRINESGEIENLEQFRMWCKMAESHKEIQFYLYTKAYDIVIPELQNDTVPSNLTVLISVWHEHGIKEFKLVMDKGNVKCFAYDDNAFDYESHGLKLTTYCKAYDESGKMNHEITCEKCQKCFNRNGNCKCIGCKAH